MHCLMTGMPVNRDAGYGLFESSGYIFLSSADCGRYVEVILRVKSQFYWPLLLSGCSHS